MAEQRKARPVSGEIMAADARDTFAQPIAVDSTDIVDADFEVVERSHARNESIDDQPAFPGSAASAGGMEMLRATRAARDSSSARGGPVFWIAGISLAAMAFWVSGGHAVVRGAALPLTWQGSSLRIAEVMSRVDSSGRRPVLLIDGAAFNDGKAAAPLPPIDIAVAANDGKILRYRLGTGADPVAPGARWDFSSRLEVPMNGIRTVTVAFSE
ncbi:hypothetical protein [Aminobacter sp. DSM 101952]|uniref:hypothetical protein n=1 Tax=Aminobacter sp. DSM 101952 TaxID=2735891 RepID=UPI000AEF2B4C|nr:hypothetical protein [Aminobacter sp. DSM 101952]